MMEQTMQGKCVILGVTGGIAAYKAAELLRLLVKAGAEVHVVMTRSAQEFVTPLTFQTLSGNPVHTELFNLIQEQEIGHISLADRADLVLVAPATANLIGKVANGLADDLLTTTIMATRAKVLFAPAMNSNMWENPIYRKNQEKLEGFGYHFVEPVYGDLACGWQGQGKLPDPQEIFNSAQGLLGSHDLAGKTVLVTAGPTREEIDPVRFLSNYSSGKMGYAIACAARNRGARVVLISGPVSLPVPNGIEMIQVVSAQEMYQAVMARAGQAEVVIKAAAVADFRPVARGDQKTKKGASETTTVELQRNPDILAELGKQKGSRILVGFAAETEQLLNHAREKLKAKNLDLIVANDVTQEGAGFNGDTNIVRFLTADGNVEELPKMTKAQVAELLLDRVTALLAGH
ncbi:MAG: bifunctional phosphopantothenoylcysteine decarboxylase/phosphopantothenate--cysteine ligase CoaBC [Desulfuromonadales bacterium]|jgi:phosphopantothenoylcysteine decarboxylase/phosphopantothenate--cysteine ligase|nr:bifunctional phosphopantothenoylcysteine decarboxylase/phosphopantothenate--cysteine ligase CoaBC [Desulfuromonadales bacterium]